ncbi:MAG: flagellar biosynthesis regulator FlaF [Alphaproteobacteria bacterium]|nr:flagellar biosynthesis regulator FlaF [Alphaproteobacteria bacterium]MBP7758433.1 flagellar biosynthesis regulator FlaF [Alphaproteobacteria bacterium]MBP7762714.1 flagellar biosynthesis regulator FlaF [Alphaproteobacteria bacterium]MBP7904412.1 flagellar biosynthesis regulator FlaF [Alphaproteobacteria bacterium]
MRSKNNNPYAQAAGAYDNNAQQNTPDQRELEGRVLLKSARMMQDLMREWDSRTAEVLEATLLYNRQIWMLFYDTAMGNPEGNRPNDLRSNIINLANFIFKRELEILSNPQKDKLNVLININKEVAAGLLTGQKAAAAQAAQSPAPAAGSSTNIEG